MRIGLQVNGVRESSPGGREGNKMIVPSSNRHKSLGEDNGSADEEIWACRDLLLFPLEPFT